MLRRPQTDRDRERDVQAILRLLPRGSINGVHTDGIRVLRRRPDGATILVPAERVGRHDKGYASSIRRQVLCVLTSAPSGAGGACGDLRQLRTTGIGAAGTRTDTGFLTGALVPDGVAHVVIRLRHHRYLGAAVRDNYYEIDTGNELAPAWGVRWLDAQGHAIDHRRA